MKAVLRRFVGGVVLFAALSTSPSAQLSSASGLQKLDPILQQKASLAGRSRVIVRADDAASLSLVIPILRQAGGILGRSLSLINGVVADLPNSSLLLVAANPLVRRVSADRLVAGAMERTAATVGSAAARQAFGYDGSGIGVAIIDSGVTSWHDDLTDPAAGAGTQRVDRFVDLVGGQPAPYDDYGHGTHVAGIVAGNGFDSGGARSGIAPGAHLVVLKVLDGAGRGRISDVIAAFEYVVAHENALNIRVVNLSVAAGVYESYNSDPLTLAAQRVSAAGIVVVAAAGNLGRSREGVTLYGGVTAPGNAPWVLTVGASSHRGTVDRGDDTMAAFSSRGPTAVDRIAKPDLVAPGVGIESLSDPTSAFYLTKSPYLLNGTVPTAYRPYLSLSGTSMAAPVVAGTVALMLQANPALSPSQVKAILRQTAQARSGYDRMTQGAGFLDAKGAIELARVFIAAPTPEQGLVSELVCSIFSCASGAGTGDSGDAFGTNDDSTVVWGTNGDDSETVVWGTNGDDSETVVWGTNGDDSETVVWGTNGDDETVVWGTNCGDPSCEPVVWNTP